jgi:hypothetical protein
MFSINQSNLIQISKINQFKLGELSPDYVLEGFIYSYTEPNFIALIKVVEKYNNQNAFNVEVISSLGKKIKSNRFLANSTSSPLHVIPKIYPKEMFFEKSVAWLMNTKSLLDSFFDTFTSEVPTILKKITDDFDWAKIISLKLFSLLYNDPDIQFDFLKVNNDLFKISLSEEELFYLWQLELSKIFFEKKIGKELVPVLNHKLNLFYKFDLLNEATNWENMRSDILRLKKEGFVFKQDDRIIKEQLDPKDFYLNYVFQSSRKRRLNVDQKSTPGIYTEICAIENKTCNSIFDKTIDIDFNEFFKVTDKIISYPAIEDCPLKLFLYTNLLTDCQ